MSEIKVLVFKSVVEMTFHQCHSQERLLAHEAGDDAMKR